MEKTILRKLWRIVGSILLMCLMWFVSAPTYAQAQITGTVKGEDGADLIGVNVILKGTTSGTITDVSGKYSIQASPSDIIVFSFVGYITQEVTIGNQSTVDVTLAADVTSLQEVIVTGYASEKKADLTGAVAVVDLAPIMNNSTGNPMQSLQGRVAGLYIERNGGSPNGENSRVLIRGSNTLGNTDPLYIIDGTPTKNPIVFNTLIPSSIESIQVLKDASAAAI